MKGIRYNSIHNKKPGVFRFNVLILIELSGKLDIRK